MILFQGLDDRVVPPEQAEAIASALEDNGIPCALLTYEGEDHGFRKAENIIHTLESELAFYGRVLGFRPAGDLPDVSMRGGTGRLTAPAGDAGGPSTRTYHPPAMTRTRMTLLVALLGVAMVTATYVQGALSVLSPFVVEEFGITRSQLGLAFAAFSLVGAAMSPVMGAFTDRGSRGVLLALFALGAIGLAVSALSPVFLVLVVGSAVGGLALGAGNPVTNRVISDQIPPARRGIVVGIKQAGPPLGLLTAGLLLPPIAVAAGWRAALAVSLVIPVAGLVATPFLVAGGSRSRPEGGDTVTGPEVRRAVIWLTVIGLGVAVALSATIAFLPLYAVEDVGVSPETAGLMASALGLTGVAGRILWGGAAGRFRRASTALLVMSTAAVLAVGALLAGRWAGAPAIWGATVALGGSAMAWHAVAWLFIIDEVGSAAVGRASGVMQVGNSVGFASGPPLLGVVIDLTDSYVAGWLVVAAIFAVSTALTVWIRRPPAAPAGPG